MTLSSSIARLFICDFWERLEVHLGRFLSPSSSAFRDEIGIMSCDDISKFGKSGMKGSESPNYFLEHESGKFFTLLEGEGHPGGSEYERSRATGVRRREKTPTHGRLDFLNLLLQPPFTNCAGHPATPQNLSLSHLGSEQ